MWCRPPAAHRSGRSDDDRRILDPRRAEDGAVAGDLFGRAGSLEVVVAQLDRRASIGGGHLADQGDRVEIAKPRRMAAAEIIRQQSAPAVTVTDPALEVPAQGQDLLDVQTIRKQDALLAG